VGHRNQGWTKSEKKGRIRGGGGEFSISVSSERQGDKNTFGKDTRFRGGKAGIACQRSGGNKENEVAIWLLRGVAGKRDVQIKDNGVMRDEKDETIFHASSLSRREGGKNRYIIRHEDQWGT